MGRKWIDYETVKKRERGNKEINKQLTSKLCYLYRHQIQIIYFACILFNQDEENQCKTDCRTTSVAKWSIKRETQKKTNP